MQAFAEIFACLPDPRASNARHDLIELLFIAVAATLCGAKSCTDMALFAEAKEPMLRTVLRLDNGPPSHDTFSAVFRQLDPVAFTQVFGRFAAIVGKTLSGPRTIAIDGKAMRHAVEKGRRHAPRVIVTAWAAEARLTLAATTAPGGNEVAGALQLLTFLDLSDVTVTADALHCHREMATEITKRNGDYALALKGNQALLLADAEVAVAAAPAGPTAATTECAHDRNETRRARVVAVPGLAAKHGFANLAAIGVIERTRECGPTRETTVRYFALSQVMSPCRLLETVRSHWDIENGLHWTLDLVLDEDRRRTRKDRGPDNLAQLHRFALNLLRADKSKGSLVGKTKRAGWDDAFLFSLLAQMR
jgi:predicted transposase YbfD/YdcC